MKLNRCLGLTGVTERFLENALQLAAFSHRPEDVGVAVEFSVDENFRQRGPVRHLSELFALGHVFKHVHNFKRIAESIEKLNRLECEAAARGGLRSFAVDENLVGC